MTDVYQIAPNTTTADLFNAIEQRLCAVKGVLNCLMEVDLTSGGHADVAYSASLHIGEISDLSTELFARIKDAPHVLDRLDHP